MNAEEIARALGGRRSGKGWVVKCPAHQDKRPSLSIDEGSNGKALVKCRAGCSQDDVIDALRGRGLWPEPHTTAPKAASTVAMRTAMPKAPDVEWTPVLPVPDGSPSPDFKGLLGAEPSAFWDYQDSRGRPLGYVARLDRADGKAILPVTWCCAGETTAWRVKAFPAPRPLYGLPQLAERPDAPVLVVEGEKVVVAAAQLFDDRVAVTWPGGSGAVGKADWRRLKGRDIVIWPDADAPGKKAAREVADHALRAGATSACIVALPDGLPDGWDLADTAPDGVDVRKLLAGAQDVRAGRLKGLSLVNASDLMAREFREPRWAIPDLVPEGAAVVAGKPKSGKSWLALDWAVAVASGGMAMGNVQCEAGDVLLLALEDTERRLQGRLRAVLQGAPAPARLTIATEWRRADHGGLDDIRAWLAIHPAARLVIVDTLALIRGKPDRDAGVYANDYEAARSLKAVADEFGIALVMNHHQRKEAASDPIDSVSGTAGLTGALDTIIVLKRAPNDPHGILYVRGRDVHESETALQFDKDTGKWLRLGAGDDFRKTQERRAVIRTLAEAGPMTPGDLASALGKRPGTMRMLLAKMLKSGDVEKHMDGRYGTAMLI